MQERERRHAEEVEVVITTPSGASQQQRRAAAAAKQQLTAGRAVVAAPQPPWAGTEMRRHPPYEGYAAAVALLGAGAFFAILHRRRRCGGKSLARGAAWWGGRQQQGLAQPSPRANTLEASSSYAKGGGRRPTSTALCARQSSEGLRHPASSAAGSASNQFLFLLRPQVLQRILPPVSRSRAACVCCEHCNAPLQSRGTIDSIHNL